MSILEAQVLLKQSEVRRVGSGNSVDILKDPWIPQDDDPYVHTVHVALNGWRKLWNLKVPPKVKNFIWRALTGCLPTKDQLLARRVAVNITCPVCNIDPENVLQTLALCPFAGLCWGQIGYMNEVQDYTSFTHRMNVALQKYSGEEIKKK